MRSATRKLSLTIVAAALIAFATALCGAQHPKHAVKPPPDPTRDEWTEWEPYLTLPAKITPALQAKLDLIAGGTIYSCARRLSVVKMQEGKLFHHDLIRVPLAALQPLHIKKVYLRGDQRPYMNVQVLLHLASDQYAAIPAGVITDRILASNDPLTTLLGGNPTIFLSPNDFPFTEAQVEDIQQHRLLPGDPESAVICSLGEPESRHTIPKDLTLLVYPGYAKVFLKEGRVFAVNYAPTGTVASGKS